MMQLLAQCVALAHVDVSYNYLGTGGTDSLAGVLAQCPGLSILNLRGNQMDFFFIVRPNFSIKMNS
jgi:hypothetical protein